MVCSSHEIDAAREVSRDLLLVVPGIRPSSGEAATNGDQKRVSTAAQAITHGADHIVVGRPIRDAADPARAFAALVAEVEAATARA